MISYKIPWGQKPTRKEVIEKLIKIGGMELSWFKN